MKKINLEQLDIHTVGAEIQLAGAIYNGYGKSFVCMFPHEKIQELVKLGMSLRDWERFINQTDIMERSVKDGNTKAIVRKSQRQIDTHVMWTVFRRDNFTCRYCGNDRCPLTIDHLILWEDGGPTVVENLVTACKPCNRKRGSTPYPEWIKGEAYAKRSEKLTVPQRAMNESIDLSCIQKVGVRSR